MTINTDELGVIPVFVNGLNYGEAGKHGGQGREGVVFIDERFGALFHRGGAKLPAGSFAPPR